MMMKKRKAGFVRGMIGVLAVLGILFFGCDTGTSNGGDSFKVATNNGTVNDVTSLGITGTTVSASPSGIVTVEINDGKIKITSVAEGTALITVSNGSGHQAKISVTVSSKGSITVGTVIKYVAEYDVPETSVQVYDYSNPMSTVSFNKEVKVHPEGSMTPNFTVGSMASGLLTLSMPDSDSFKTWVEPYLIGNLEGIATMPNSAKFYWANFYVPGETGGLIYSTADDVDSIEYLYFTESAIISGTVPGTDVIFNINAHAGWNKVYSHFVDGTDWTITTDSGDAPTMKWLHGRQ
jgi:hypothetical protein